MAFQRVLFTSAINESKNKKKVYPFAEQDDGPQGKLFNIVYQHLKLSHSGRSWFGT
jgi:hypothetical protein